MRLFAALALALALRAQPATGAVEGVVANSVTPAPVRKALVTLREADNYAAIKP